MAPAIVPDGRPPLARRPPRGRRRPALLSDPPV